MAQRKPKISYSCLPCKALKIKCDHQLPCSNCTKNNREDQCLKNPPKSLTHFKELIKPNSSFGRVAKQANPTRSRSLDRKDSALEKFIEKNYQLQQQIEQLNSQLVVHQSLPTIHDLFTLSSEKKFIVVKSMLGFLPSQQIAPFIFKHYFSVNLIHPLNKDQFEKLHSQFLFDLSRNREIDLSFLAQMFMILSFGVLGIPKVQLSKCFPGEDISNKVRLWVNSARQILILQPEPSLLKLQVLVLLQFYFKDFEHDKVALDYLFHQSVNDAYELKLHLPLDTHPSFEREARKQLWCCLTGFGVERSLQTSKPLIISADIKEVRLETFNYDDTSITVDSNTKSSSNQPTESALMITSAKISQIVKKSIGFEDDLSTKLKRTINVDKELDEFLAGLPWFLKTDNLLNGSIKDKRILFQLTCLHLEVCIVRSKLYQDFHNFDIPVVGKICLSIAKSMFTLYKKLKELVANLDAEPLFNLQKQLILRSLIHQSIILFDDSLEKGEKLDILSEVTLILDDLEKLYKNKKTDTCFIDISQNHQRLIKSFKHFLITKHNEFMISSTSTTSWSAGQQKGHSIGQSVPYETPLPSPVSTTFTLSNTRSVIQDPLEKMKLNSLLAPTITSIEYGLFSTFSIRESLDIFNSLKPERLRVGAIRNSLVKGYYAEYFH